MRALTGRARTAAVAIAAGAMLIAASAGSAGCSDSEEPAPAAPTTRLAEALAGIGGGGAHGSLGVGWADSRLLAEDGGLPLVADALGPNANTVIEAARALRRRFGFDPLAADRFVSVGGSYAFGLRVDGADARGLAEALIAAGGRARSAGGHKLIEIGDYAVVPQPLLDVGINGLGAFDALGRDLAVLAISDRARAALLGRGERLLDEPIYAAAADCLGEVDAARMVPDKLLLSVEVGIDLVALGIRGRREILCVIGGTSERAAQVAEALEGSLAPEAKEPVTGQPVGDSIASVEVSTAPYAEVQSVRAELELAPGAERGFLFGTVGLGSLVSLINGEAVSGLP